MIATGRDPRRLALLRGQLGSGRVIDNDASDPLTGEALAEEIHASAGPIVSGSLPDMPPLESLSQIDAAAFDQMMATLNVRGPVPRWRRSPRESLIQGPRWW